MEMLRAVNSGLFAIRKYSPEILIIGGIVGAGVGTIWMYPFANMLRNLLGDIFINANPVPKMTPSTIALIERPIV